MTYFLDTNAHLPLILPEKSRKKINDLEKSSIAYGHPLAPNKIGKKASILIEEARHNIAKLLGAKSSLCISFTHSCTEANNWAGKILKSPTWFSPFEHHSMFDSINKHCKDSIKSKIKDNGEINDSVVEYNNYVASYVNSEIGFITNLKDIRAKTKNILISDMAQAAGKIPINLKDLNVDIATFGAHKFAGPIGIGFIYIKNGKLWENYNNIGTAYNKDIPGSPNTIGIYATSLALEYAVQTMEERKQKCLSFFKIIEDELENMKFKVIGKNGNRIHTTSFLRVPGNNNGILLLSKLSDKGIHIGLGSACGSFFIQNSEIMKNFNVYENNTNYIRLSQFGDYDDKDAKIILENINKIIKKI